MACRAGPWFCLARCLVALLTAPWIANDYLVTVLILILYLAYTGQAWNIMMGFAGQLSLGHAIYVGLGAYIAAVLFTRFGIGPWIGLLAAIPVAAACGAIIGFLAFRFGVAGVYFAILTIAFAEFARIGFDHLERGQRLRRPVPAGRAICAQRSVAAARRSDDVLLRDPRGDGAGVPALPYPAQAGSAITGSPSARTNRRRAPPASIHSATRCMR